MTPEDAGAAMRQAADRAAAALLAELGRGGVIAPTPDVLAAMGAVVCPEDGGEHPLEWSEPGPDPRMRQNRPKETPGRLSRALTALRRGTGAAAPGTPARHTSPPADPNSPKETRNDRN